MDLQRHIEKIHSQVDEDSKPQLEHILDQLSQTAGPSLESQDSSSFDDSTSTISEVDDDESMVGLT